MQAKFRPLISIFILLFIFYSFTFSQSFEFHGQTIGWTQLNLQTIKSSNLGFRFLPKLEYQHDLTRNWSMEAKLILDTRFDRSFNKSSELQAQIYRSWWRFQTRQLRFRIGRQKINFGQSRFLRSLMWFDRIDPRDPLQLTPGVNAFLLRYFWLNNANAWFWAIYDDGQKLGLDRFSGLKGHLQWGARLQLPVSTAELGLTFHTKKFKYFDQNQSFTASQERVAIDGFWDVGAGLWFEYVFSNSQVPKSMLPNIHYLTLGCDYTLGLGNGLHFSLETLNLFANQTFFRNVQKNNLFALEWDYPFGLLDQILIIHFYYWQEQQLLHYINWQRSYDNWQIFFSLFFGNQSFKLLGAQGQTLINRGFRLLLVFNF